MHIFQKIRNLFRKEEPNEASPTIFRLRGTNRNGGEIVTDFPTYREAKAYLQEHGGKRHLIYIRSVLERVTQGVSTTLEWHEHLVANVDWEVGRLEQRAQEEGATLENIEAYPNESSASSLKAIFNYD